MRQILALMLLIGIVFQLSGANLRLLGYTINKNFIASQLCEKKSIPGNHCEGKCQLKKQLNEDSEKGKGNPHQSVKSTIDLQITTNEEVTFAFFDLVADEIPLMNQTFLHSGHPSAVFHPPA